MYVCSCIFLSDCSSINLLIYFCLFTSYWYYVYIRLLKFIALLSPVPSFFLIFNILPVMATYIYMSLHFCYFLFLFELLYVHSVHSHSCVLYWIFYSYVDLKFIFMFIFILIFIFIFYFSYLLLFKGNMLALVDDGRQPQRITLRDSLNIFINYR